MNHPRVDRSRISGFLVAAVGVFLVFGLVAGTASAKDRNRDRIPDRWEKRHRLSLKVNQARRDQDGDHLGNRAEFLSTSDPRDPDSDNDGVMDGEENAGTIASFDAETGRLTIDLFNGDTVSGLVTEDTRVRCGRGCHRHRHRHETDSDDASASRRDGPNFGQASGPPGQGEDENDNPPGDDGTSPGASEGPGQGTRHRARCTTADLVEGASVKDAVLVLRDGTATFAAIKLARMPN